MENQYYNLCPRCLTEGYITNPLFGEVLKCNDCETPAEIVKVMDVGSFKLTYKKLLETDFKDQRAYFNTLIDDAEELSDNLGLVILRVK